MAIPDAVMFTVKKINRLKILQDVIDRNLRFGQAAEMPSCLMHLLFGKSESTFTYFEGRLVKELRLKRISNVMHQEPIERQGVSGDGWGNKDGSQEHVRSSLRAL